jgi:hypothetical protein
VIGPGLIQLFFQVLDLAGQPAASAFKMCLIAPTRLGGLKPLTRVSQLLAQFFHKAARAVFKQLGRFKLPKLRQDPILATSGIRRLV